MAQRLGYLSTSLHRQPSRLRIERPGGETEEYESAVGIREIPFLKYLHFVQKLAASSYNSADLEIDDPDPDTVQSGGEIGGEHGGQRDWLCLAEEHQNEILTRAATAQHEPFEGH